MRGTRKSALMEESEKLKKEVGDLREQRTKCRRARGSESVTDSCTPSMFIGSPGEDIDVVYNV